MSNAKRAIQALPDGARHAGIPNFLLEAAARAAGFLESGSWARLDLFNHFPLFGPKQVWETAGGGVSVAVSTHIPQSRG
jgi:hypothetical protein